MEQRAPRPTAAVVAVGTELATGLRTDTNGPEIARALESAGYDVTAVSAVPDDRAHLEAALRHMLGRCSLVVVTGGLGPTHDDVTREAAAAASGLPLERDSVIQEALSTIVERHAVPAAAPQVLRQADVLRGARVLAPASGTAPGQLVAVSGSTLILLPGPPAEMRPMLAQALSLLGRTTARSPELTIRTVGRPESDVQIIAQAVLGLHPGIDLTVLAQPMLVDVILRDAGAGERGLGAAAETIAVGLGDAVYGRGDQTLASSVLDAARTNGRSLAVAESCTGGLVAGALTAVPGSSDVFLGGVVAYANSVKRGLLAVDDSDLTRHGAVSGQVAEAMARGAQAATDATTAIATTGIAGPDGGSDGKPVGTVWFAVADGETVVSFRRHLPGDRDAVRARAVVIALDTLRRALAGLALPGR